MTYNVSFSETDLELVREALDAAAFVKPDAEPFERMRDELGEFKARQDAS